MNRIIVELASVSLTKTSVFATFSIKKKHLIVMESHSFKKVNDCVSWQSDPV